MNCPAVLTPLEALLLGAIAGFLATLGLSVLSRIVPSIRNLTYRESRGSEREARGEPRDRFDPRAVEIWQDHTRSPASRSPADQRDVPAVLTPESALVKAQGPGPEGAAEQFAVKLVAGLFGRDITRPSKRAGKLVHYVYGSLWGAIYALLQVSFGVPWFVSGAAHGLLVWWVGPAWLAPKMRVMLPPRALRPLQNALLIGAHVLWGVAVGFAVFELSSWRVS